MLAGQYRLVRKHNGKAEKKSCSIKAEAFAYSFDGILNLLNSVELHLHDENADNRSLKQKRRQQLFFKKTGINYA
jgi:hypothetical protein